MKFIFLFAFFVLVLSSCDDEKSGKRSSAYKGYIPNFSVNVPANSMTLSSMLKSTDLKEEEEITFLEQEETLGSRIDCRQQLINLNNSPRFPTDAVSAASVADCGGSNSNLGPSVLCKSKVIGLAVYLYAKSQFYDCNARQQFQEDGLTKECVLRTGNTGNIGDDDLCGENDQSPTKLLYAHMKNDEAPEDFTRFVSWTMDPNEPSTGDLKGLMINKYLQENPDGRTKTRVSLDRTSRFRTIDSTLASYSSSNGELTFIIRGHFREAGSNGTVTDNYIVGRYWQENYQKVIALKAHLRSGSGSSIFVKICAAANEQAALASTCRVDGSVVGVFFDSSGVKQSAAGTGVITDGNNSLFNPPAGSHLASFFNHSSSSASVIRNYFNPDLFSPENNQQ